MYFIRLTIYIAGQTVDIFLLEFVSSLAPFLLIYSHQQKNVSIIKETLIITFLFPYVSSSENCRGYEVFKCIVSRYLSHIPPCACFEI